MFYFTLTSWHEHVVREILSMTDGGLPRALILDPITDRHQRLHFTSVHNFQLARIRQS
jgi:hypothetical protein